MSYLNFLTPLLLLTTNPTAYANNKVGNGGDVIRCENPKTTELLDFYENPISTTDLSGTPTEIAEGRFKTLVQIAPKLGRQYQKRLSSIMDEIDFKKDIELKDIHDSHHLYKPAKKDCTVRQIAIRKKSPLPGEKIFIIDQAIWSELTASHQAGLLVHEIVYEHLSRLGETDSIKSRKIVSYLFSDKLNKKDFWNLMQQLEVPIYP